MRAPTDLKRSVRVMLVVIVCVPIFINNWTSVQHNVSITLLQHPTQTKEIDAPSIETPVAN